MHLDFLCSNVPKGKFTMLKNGYVDYNLQISEDICIIMNISFKSDSWIINSLIYAIQVRVLVRLTSTKTFLDTSKISCTVQTFYRTVKDVCPPCKM